jgi:hypothetical protein
MGRLVPARAGMEYYRNVKIAGEDVVEPPVVEPSLAVRRSKQSFGVGILPVWFGAARSTPAVFVKRGARCTVPVPE